MHLRTTRQITLIASQMFDNYQENKASQALISLAKLSTNAHKYSGRSESFDYYFSIFLSNCETAGVPKNSFIFGFNQILKGDAYNFFHTYKADFIANSIEYTKEIFK